MTLTEAQTRQQLIDDKLGFYREEHRATQKRNPYFAEILERLDNIEKQIKK